MISARRYYIDYFYFKETNHLSGTVLDIGGKKENKRGFFKPNNNLNCYYLTAPLLSIMSTNEIEASSISLTRPSTLEVI